MPEAATLITYRAAWPDEIERACALIGPVHSRGETRYFVAVLPAPVERLAGAAAWNDDGAGSAVFEWKMLPAHRGGETETALLRGLRAEVGRQGGARLRTTEMLAEGSEPERAVIAAGFRRRQSNECFELDAAVVRERVERIATRALDDEGLPRGVEVVAPSEKMREGVERLVLQHGLLTPRELRAAFEGTGIVDPALSFVIVSEGEVRCVYLARAAGDAVTVLALAVAEPSPLPSGLACAIVMQRSVRSWSPAIRKVRFRADPERSPATARLARGFRGTRIGWLHSYEAETGA